MAALLVRTLLEAAAAAAPLWCLRRGPALRLPFSSLGFGRLPAAAPAPALAVKTRCLAGPRLLAGGPLPLTQAVVGMKTKGVVRRRCKDCFFVRRRGRLFVYCKSQPRHKQRKL